MPRPKRGDPEMLLVSFCDIVTITICAMFMAMIVVIEESMKIPVVTPVPMVRPTTNIPVYFECRNKMVYHIDYDELRKVFQDQAASMKRRPEDTAQTMLDRIRQLDAGNKYYRLDPSLAMMGLMGLLPSTNAVDGSTADEVKVFEGPSSFEKMMKNMDHKKQYFVFFVRDGSFDVFRACRQKVVDAKFEHGWEYLTKDEPITFEGIMRNIGTQ